MDSNGGGPVDCPPAFVTKGVTSISLRGGLIRRGSHNRLGGMGGRSKERLLLVCVLLTFFLDFACVKEGQPAQFVELWGADDALTLPTASTLSCGL